MTDEEITALVAEILELPEGSVEPFSDLEDLGWDSLSNLTLLSIADERFGVTIDPVKLAESTHPVEIRELFARGRR